MIGCLCIHGFTGAPYEVEPLALYLKQTTDWNVQSVTLPGHGDELQLKGILYQEWIATAELELLSLYRTCDTIFLIGFSMGGMIASYLAAKYPIARLVLLSAAAKYVNPKQMFQDTRQMVKESLSGLIDTNPLYDRYRHKLSSTPLSAAVEFMKLVKQTKSSLEKLHLPVLIVQGESDGIVPASSAEFIYHKIPSSQKEMFFLPDCKHHVCHEPCAQQLFEKVEQFLKKSF
ncbi:alpha/beta fold hydrolase [Bacillus sp. Bos-x628]|uniref:alpha/beta hydrolase n=1 Tax=Bacillus maqinnsis TaxID=3229854 RepID=UPI00338EAECB